MFHSWRKYISRSTWAFRNVHSFRVRLKEMFSPIPWTFRSILLAFAFHWPTNCGFISFYGILSQIIFIYNQSSSMRTFVQKSSSSIIFHNLWTNHSSCLFMACLWHVIYFSAFLGSLILCQHSLAPSFFANIPWLPYSLSAFLGR